MVKCRIKTQVLVCLYQSHIDFQLRVFVWFLLKSMEILALLSKKRLRRLLNDHLLSVLSEQGSIFFFNTSKSPSPIWGQAFRGEGAVEKWEHWYALVQKEVK